MPTGPIRMSLLMSCVLLVAISAAVHPTIEWPTSVTPVIAKRSISSR